MKGNLKIFQNFFIIGLSYSSNLLLPLLLIPHFVNKLGIGLYGTVAIAQSLMSYMNVVIEYHFSTITVKEISINHSNNKILNEIFCRTFSIRLFLMVVAFLIVAVVLFVYPPFQSHYDIVIFSCTTIVGQMLLPNWFLLGMEEVGAIAILNIVFKGLYIVLALLLVQSGADAILPNFFLGTTNIIAGIFGIFYIFYKYKFKFWFASLGEIAAELKSGYLMAISNISIALYTSVAPFILALFCGPKIVGEYVVAERILALARGVLTVYFQATYARAAKLMTQGKEILNKFYRETFPILIFAIVSGCVLFFSASQEIMLYFFRISSPVVAEYVKLLLIVVIIISLNIPYYQRLLMMYTKSANIIIMIGCPISILLNFILIPSLGPIGCIIAVAVTELFITTSLYYTNVKYKLL